MERRGECNSCGWCCQYEGIHRNVVSPAPGEEFVSLSDRRFYELRGGRVIADGRRVLYVVQAFAPCSAHDNDGKRCTTYDDRPDICREFPSVPEQIEGTPCSHWFESDEAGEIVRRGGTGSPYATPPRFEVR